MKMKKIATIVAFTLICLLSIACANHTSQEPSYASETEPTDAYEPETQPSETHTSELEQTETPSTNPPYEHQYAESDLTDEEIIAFILRAEQVYRDIIYAQLFSGHWDEELDEWIQSEYTAEVNERFGHVWRVLPSSGFSSIAELNAAIHEYWDYGFVVGENIESGESNDYAEIDGTLYWFPAGACDVGGTFLNILWERPSQFEVLRQGNYITVNAKVYYTFHGEIYTADLQWVIENDKITTRWLEWDGHRFLA